MRIPDYLTPGDDPCDMGESPEVIDEFRYELRKAARAWLADLGYEVRKVRRPRRKKTI